MIHTLTIEKNEAITKLYMKSIKITPRLVILGIPAALLHPIGDILLAPILWLTAPKKRPIANQVEVESEIDELIKSQDVVIKEEDGKKVYIRNKVVLTLLDYELSKDRLVMKFRTLS